MKNIFKITGFFLKTLVFIIGIICIIDLFGLLVFAVRCKYMPKGGLLARVNDSDIGLSIGYNAEHGYYVRPESKIRAYGEEFYQGQLLTMSYDSFYLKHPIVPEVGIRDSEEWNPDAQVKILHLGDSFTYGIGVEMEETWRFLLRQRLRGNGYSVTSVYDQLLSGADAFGTYHRVKHNKDILKKISPNYVILGIYLGNDIEDASSYADDTVPGSPKYQEKIKKAVKNERLFSSNTTLNNIICCLLNYKERSYTYMWFQCLRSRGPLIDKETRRSRRKDAGRYLIKEFNLFFPKYSSVLAGRFGKSHTASLVLINKDESLQRGLKRIPEGVMGLNQICSEIGAKLVVYIFPMSEQVYRDEILKIDPAYNGYDFFSANKYILKQLTAAGITVYDLTPQMIASRREDPCYYFPLDMHWSVSGNRKAFELISRHFLSVIKDNKK